MNRNRVTAGRPDGGRFAHAQTREQGAPAGLAAADIDAALQTDDMNAHARLLANADAAVRANAAANPLTTLDQARTLAGDRSEHVRWELANHERPEIAHLVVDDPSAVVRFAARTRLGLPIPADDAALTRIALSLTG